MVATTAQQVNRQDLLAADRRAREAALDAARSFIVQAPAGSGKTELLIQRFLALLARVAIPEEVVAITFTVKAAGEMRARVLGALNASRAGRAPESEHERRTLDLAAAVLRADGERQWGLTDNPGRLRIQTIDSLCASLTAQMPLLSRLGARPEPTEDADELYREAARETLALLEEPGSSAPVATLLRHLDNDTGRAEELLARLLGRRDQWLRHHRRFDRTGLTQCLINLVSGRLQQARAALPGEMVAELLFCARYASANLAAAGSESPIASVRDLATLPGVTADQLARWQGLAHLLLTTENAPRRQMDARLGFPAASEKGIDATERQRRTQAKQRINALLAQLAETTDFAAALAEAKLLPQPEYSDDQWRVIEALSPLLKLAVAQLELVFRARGVVDFTQLLIAATQALGEPEAPTDLALALDYRIRHLLVDEFQDTSLSQFELLRRVTAGWEPGDGRTLFVVGDPMQSVYRFREAEVGLFLRAQHEGIGSVDLEPLTLSLNFRSQAAIVEWVNGVFALVLPVREDLGTGAVPFSPSISRIPALSGQAVTVHAVGDGIAEANMVVELVAAATAEDVAQHIAILVRNRSHLSAIVPALKGAGMRFRAIEIETLFHRPAVQDLHALTRALLHPADRAAWLSVLRAPWCGLTLIDLEILTTDSLLARESLPRTPTWGEGTNRLSRTIWQSMIDTEPAGRLSRDGQSRLARVVEALSPAIEHRARGTLRQRIEGGWLRLGGPASVQEPTDLEDAQVYLDLVEELEQGGDLENLAALETELGRLHALPDVQAPDTLQVMTIHKAKGLEFDTVILAGLGSDTGGDPPELLRWLEQPRGHGDSDLLLAAINPGGDDDDPIYSCVTRLRLEHQRHEEGRLLYVASTRARRRLHLVTQVKLKQSNTGATVAAPPSKGALLARLWPALQSGIERDVGAAGSRTTFGTARTVADPMTYPLRRLASRWALPALPPRVAWQRVEREEEARDTVVEFSWVGETARHVGSVVHAFLQRMADEGLGKWNTERIERLDAVLRLALKQEGVPERELGSAHARVMQGLRGVLADPRARWILGSDHQEARSEYRLTGELDGAFVNVALDRTFVDRHGIRWIVDYKTGTHQGGDVEVFLDREHERYRAQLEKYAALLARTESRPIRLGLYFPLLNGWREWEAPVGSRTG
jgi:ATP-dependent helicase/nuclease subunit A